LTLGALELRPGRRLQRTGVSVEEVGELPQREAEAAEGEDPVKTAERLVVVEAVARLLAFARSQEAELVVVVQRPHRHPSRRGQLADRPEAGVFAHGDEGSA
jgi:hypothetical protein